VIEPLVITRLERAAGEVGGALGAIADELRCGALRTGGFEDVR
jgi:hypothetical protein